MEIDIWKLFSKIVPMAITIGVGFMLVNTVLDVYYDSMNTTDVDINLPKVSIEKSEPNLTPVEKYEINPEYKGTDIQEVTDELDYDTMLDELGTGYMDKYEVDDTEITFDDDLSDLLGGI